MTTLFYFSKKKTWETHQSGNRNKRGLFVIDQTDLTEKKSQYTLPIGRSGILKALKNKSLMQISAIF